MKILHLISSGGMYGAEAMLLNLGAAQQRLGCELVLGVFHNKLAPHLEVAERAAPLGLPVEVIPCRGRMDRAAADAIRDCAKRRGIAVIHTHGYKANIYGLRVARSLGIPLVITCHLWTGSSLSVRVYEFLDAQVMRRADKIVAVSDAIEATLRSAGIPRDKLQTIYNGIDLAPFAAAEPTLRRELGSGGRPLIALVGRLERQKGIEYFIRAAAEVVVQSPDARFIVIGEGSQRQPLESLIRELGMTERISLLGERKDMPGVYASLDLFVLSSIDEGMPMTILEALASGRPTIATRVGAVGKLILNEETGLLVEARSVPALRDAMLRCLEDSSFARALGLRGEEHVRTSFSADSMARQYIETYRKAGSAREARMSASLQEV
jgi:glycosyltransferase involved in cell wall biosynthesis